MQNPYFMHFCHLWCFWSDESFTLILIKWWSSTGESRKFISLKQHTYIQMQDLLPLVKEPIQEDPRSCKLWMTCKISLAQYGQASLSTEMLLERLLPHSISNALLSSTERHSYLFSSNPPIRSPPALLLHSQQRGNETWWLRGQRISLQWFFKRAQMLLGNGSYDEAEDVS